MNIQGIVITHPSRRKKAKLWINDPNFIEQEAILFPFFARNAYSFVRSSAEMGCKIAHHMANIKALNSNADYFLILEDDVIYRDGWLDDLRKLYDLAESPSIINLCEHRGPKSVKTLKTRQISLNPYIYEITELNHGGTGGTVATFFSRKGLEFIVNAYNTEQETVVHNPEIIYPSDGMMSRKNLPEFHKQGLTWMSTGNVYKQHKTFFSPMNIDSIIRNDALR